MKINEKVAGVAAVIVDISDDLVVYIGDDDLIKNSVFLAGDLVKNSVFLAGDLVKNT